MENERKYFLTDWESGGLYPVSKEQYEAFQRQWEILKPKIDSLKGVPLLFGTGGDMDGDQNSFAKMFYNPETYKIKD